MKITGSIHVDGLLTGLQPPPPATNVTVNPYVLVQLDHYVNYDPSQAANNSTVKFGGDLFGPRGNTWGIRSPRWMSRSRPAIIIISTIRSILPAIPRS